MPATPSHLRHPAPEASVKDAPTDSLEARWAALQNKADIIADLAHLTPDADESAQALFGQLLNAVDDHTASVAERGIEDMEMLVEVGLKALLDVKSRGQDVHAPALALWRELYHAREAVLSILEPQPA